MTNNFDLIIPLLNFNSKDDFYFLQILQRKKENDDVGSNSHVVRNYYIKSVDYLLSHKEEIINICNVFNARAMLRLNKRSFEKVAYKCMVNLANTISNRGFDNCRRCYDKACGDGHNESPAYWLLDFDTKDPVSPLLLAYINHMCPPEGIKTVTTIPSKNGYHLITHPFDVRKFIEVYNNISIHKDNPTNLYIP